MAILESSPCRFAPVLCDRIVQKHCPAFVAYFKVRRQMARAIAFLVMLGLGALLRAYLYESPSFVWVGIVSLVGALALGVQYFREE